MELTWVEPGLSESWDQSSNPTPVNFFPGEETFVPVTNSNPSGLSPVEFSNADAEGGFEDNQGLVPTTGAQVYSGSESSPVFAPSSFTLLDVKTGKDGTLTFTAVASVPEPATWVMALLGFAGLAFMGYRGARQKSLPLAGVPPR